MFDVKFDTDAEVMFAAMKAANLPRFENLSPQAARDLLAKLRAAAKVAPVEVGEVRDLECPVGDRAIRIRLYRPSGAAGALPAFVYLHGGGFVVGSIESNDALCRRVTEAAGIAVVSVDYRLAPENPFPAGLEDARAAIVHVVDQAAELGVDPDRIGFGGDSAGGNLAAVAALMSRDGELPPARALVMACPVVDLSLSQASHGLDLEGLAVNGSTMRWFRGHYLTQPGHADDWRVSPLRAETLAGLPPCHLITAGIDPLRDEGLEMAHRLSECDVRFVHEHYPGQMHGFITAGINTPTGRRACASIASFLRCELSA